MQKDIGQFITHMKALGFDVKLDTNGSFPERLEKIIQEGEVDYIAMDIKNSLGKYAKTAGRETGAGSGEKLQADIKRSINLIMSSGIPYEFRTTIAHPLHEVKDFEGIGKLIKGADKYYLQNFVKSKHINENVDYKPFTDKELQEAEKIMKKYVKEVGIR